jgi:hypothetical protein
MINIEELAGGVPDETGDSGPDGCARKKSVVDALHDWERNSGARRAAAFRQHWEIDTWWRSKVGRRRAGITDNPWEKGD